MVFVTGCGGGGRFVGLGLLAAWFPARKPKVETQPHKEWEIAHRRWETQTSQSPYAVPQMRADDSKI